MYVKPEVTRYSGTELLDLMGPVETGYCEIRQVEEVTRCQKELRVLLPDGTTTDDYEERLGFYLMPQRPGECSDSSVRGVNPPDERGFGDIAIDSTEMLVPLDVCVLAECGGPAFVEQWMLEFTLYRENGSRDTCDIVLDVLD